VNDVDAGAGWLTTLVTCRAAGEREAGVYECRDVDGLARDFITVSVARRTDDGRGLPFSSPLSVSSLSHLK